MGTWDRVRRAAWALGVGIVLLAPSPRAAEATPTAAAVAAVRTHEARYEGRFLDDPRFERAFGDLETAVARGLAVIADRLGLEPRGEARIHVYVHDADTERFGHDRARCRTRRVGAQEFQHVDLYAEYFVSGDCDLQTVLTHELVHAVMRERMGQARYERLPVWLREGLAVAVADEGERHLHRTLLAAERVDALMVGLERGRRSVHLYPYAWLAVEHLRAVAGPTALTRLVKGLVAGRDAKRLLGRIHGEGYAAFERGVRTFAAERIRAAACGLDAIKRARRLYRGRHFAKARAACEDFLDEHEASAFAPTARYVRARSWFREGRFAEAEAGFRACLESDRGRSGWVDECHLFLGISLLELTRADEAVAMLRAYLDLHPYATQRDLGLLALGRALRALDRETEAREAFDAVAAVPGVRAAHRAAAARELAMEDA